MEMTGKLARGAAAFGLTAALMLGGGYTAYAAGTTYTPVTGGSTTISKYLVMDSDANVPNATFTFVVTAGSAGTSGSGIYAGDDTNRVTGTPSVKYSDTDTAVTFSSNDTKYASAQTGDSVTLTDGQSYAKETFTVDFSGVSFKEPGIYRYKLTESGSNQGVENDTNSSRILDVYVTNKDDGALQVQSYILSKDSATAGSDTAKSTSFTNTYTSHDLTISKTVSGNQASRDEYFKFTVNISGAVAGTKYTVGGSYDATTKTNGINTSTYTNPTTLTVGEGGTVSQDFYLQNGQNIVIEGLANGTKYSITENTNGGSGGYTATATVTGDDADVTNGASSGVTTDATVSDTGDSATGITADTTVAFTNSKSGTIPTGVIMSVLPGAAVCLVAAAGLIALLLRYRRKKAQLA